jgi:hypothetical protein
VPSVEPIADRVFPRVYRTSGRADAHEFLLAAVVASGARLLYSSEHTRAPVFVGVELPENDERLGILSYPFRATSNEIRNRPPDEHRLQIRYGCEASWAEDHPLAFDVAGVDTTLVLGVHPEAGIFVGLDPLLYDPLPMGISIEFKDAHVADVHQTGWSAWERVNRGGTRRSTARSLTGLETLIGFTPNQLIRYVRLEREATSLGLDPVLRMRAALGSSATQLATVTRHQLEETFHLTSQELLEIISSRRRLTVAVRGGVAEHHLLKTLRDDPDVVSAQQIDRDGPPDVEATLRDGRLLRVECKNGEEHGYANGDGRVEVQKTRASKNDPASRFYEPGQFDVLAVCLWPDEGPPRFVYRRTDQLERHSGFEDRLAVLHHIDQTWARRLTEAYAPTQS